MDSLYLPYVNSEIGFSVHEEIKDICNDEEYIESYLERLEEENPTIATWIKSYSDTTDDPDGAAVCALIVYRLLESQAEADQMLKDIAL